jgi:STE24 endopeptidase
MTLPRLIQVRRFIPVFLGLWLLAAPAVRAEETAPIKSPTLTIPAGAVATPGQKFDPAAATKAWLDSMPADKRAKSDAYFEGTYWLLLWNFLLGAAIALLLLNARISARMRDFAERTTRFKAMQVVLYMLPYILLTSVLTFPLNVYENFFRQHQYGMANQTFGPWFGDQVKGLLISIVATCILMIALYAVFRRAPRTWWLWGTAVSIVFLSILIMIGPVFLDPIFNKYKPLEDPKISGPILTMARANQIPVDQVFYFDASKQTNRVSANVSGFLGTARIALNDNLLNQCTIPEIRMVMAHEMGHYVLNHVGKFLVYFILLISLGFALTRIVFDASVRRWGSRWGVRGIGDPAGFPLLGLILSVYFFALTPLLNSIVRVTEREADAFGINTSGEPDGFAAVSLKLGQYRKLDPGPLEEMIFFDHPSGRARIRMAMDWKAEHLPAAEKPPITTLQ